MLLTWFIDTFIVTVNVDDDDDDEDDICHVELATAGGTADGFFFITSTNEDMFSSNFVYLSVSNLAQKFLNRLA